MLYGLRPILFNYAYMPRCTETRDWSEFGTIGSSKTNELLLVAESQKSIRPSTVLQTREHHLHGDEK